MSLETIISQFGYPALVVGLLLEGETVLVLAAFVAHRGYLDLPSVIAIGFLIMFASDQFFFWLGRTRGYQFLESRPSWKSNVEKTKSLLHHNTTLLLLGFDLCTDYGPLCHLYSASANLIHGGLLL